ncbi:MAG TPA: hypothetical protein VN037_11645, partial [Verrucomicrobiae bacterium]|nr:hypothetical protein [Verrucomicrobiae bacterium]
SAKFWVGLVYVLIPLGFVLYGVNDIFDVEADRLNPRKGTFLFGSLGRREQLAALRWQIVALQIPFVAAFLVWIGPQVFLWFGVLLSAVTLYNAPRIGFKTRPPFDVLMQASYLLVFVLSSWVNGAPQLPWQTFAFGALFCDAFAPVWGSHGYCAGSRIRQDHQRGANRRVANEAADGCISQCGSCAG